MICIDCTIPIGALRTRPLLESLPALSMPFEFLNKAKIPRFVIDAAIDANYGTNNASFICLSQTTR